ncbi:MAG: hypothetical protein A2W99_08270 [Bacteroidetes bacterium GWF2_33_16]|nr:MAG: hypothetical protein A2X00_11280 [Bacteroidetes bacterium GWE2_32_14]OFY03839.1 MAG: hypothetical protein A2W99_08270 [Bacteroidetes bacterium GWF2_33_16]
MRVSILVIIVFIVFSKILLAQDDHNSSDLYPTAIFHSLAEKKDDNGNVVIYQDDRLNKIVWKHVSQNKEFNGVQGFRIRIFSDLGQAAREKSQDANAKFNELFPEISVYREYDSPYFKVYAGDYRTKNDAIKDFKRIKTYFPSAFIVPGRINFPKLDD